MTTEAELMQALRRADAAGDTPAAQAIARRIQQMRSASVVDAPRVQTNRLGNEANRQYSPSNGGVSDFFAGVGKSVYDTGRGIGQLAGAVSDEDVARSRQLDAPLMESGAGVLGTAGGMVAQLVGPGAAVKGVGSLAQGANLMRTAQGAQELGSLNAVANAANVAQRALLPTTAKGAATQGAVIGGLQPATSGGERFANTAFGAGGAFAGAKVGDAIAGLARPPAPMVAPQTASAVRAAREAGYVLPPGEVRPTGLTHVVEGLSGKQQLGQAASTKNQKVTNQLARRALGVGDDVPLSHETLDAIRAEAGKAYEAIGSAGMMQTDATYKATLQNIAKKYDTAAQAFPDANRPTIATAVKGLDVPEFDAAGGIAQIKILREDADKAFRAGDSAQGRAFSEASKALERVIERNLAAQGKQDLLAAFTGARETIAKTYTVQKALNPETGNVSAQALAALRKQRKPLSGDLKTVARVGGAFPKATQTLKDPYRAFSPWDFAAGGLGFGAGGPALAATVAARPVARAAMLSQPMQAMMANKALGGRAILPQMLPNTPQARAFLEAQRRAAIAGGAGYGVLDDEEDY